MSGYKTQSSDTSIEVERLLIERYRAMTPAEKLDMVRRLSLACEELALAGPAAFTRPRANASSACESPRPGSRPTS